MGLLEVYRRNRTGYKWYRGPSSSPNVRVELIPSLLSVVKKSSTTYYPTRSPTILYIHYACTDLSTSSIRAGVFSRCVSCQTPHIWHELISRWSKEDHEVFDLVSALEQAEGISSSLPGLASLLIVKAKE